MSSRDCCAAVQGRDCHCAICHQTFSSLAWFDRHQDVAYGAVNTPVIICHPPASLGLVQDYRGTWTTPEAAISRLSKAETMAERRQQVAA